MDSAIRQPMQPCGELNRTVQVSYGVCMRVGCGKLRETETFSRLHETNRRFPPSPACRKDENLRLAGAARELIAAFFNTATAHCGSGNTSVCVVEGPHHDVSGGLAGQT
jgi:hypothetical protein